MSRLFYLDLDLDHRSPSLDCKAGARRLPGRRLALGDEEKDDICEDADDRASRESQQAGVKKRKPIGKVGRRQEEKANMQALPAYSAFRVQLHLASPPDRGTLRFKNALNFNKIRISLEPDSSNNINIRIF